MLNEELNVQPLYESGNDAKPMLYAFRLDSDMPF